MSRFLCVGFTLVVGWLVAADGTAQAVAAGEEGAQARVTGSNNSASATSSLLRLARLTIAGVPLATAVSELAETSEVWIAYSPTRLAREGNVDCDCATLTVGQALDHLLAHTAFRYAEVEGHIVIIPQVITMPSNPQDILRAAPRPTTVAAVQTSPATRAARSVAQQGVITGRVTDAGTGSGLAGATIRVQGTRLGAVTNAAGQYIITDVPAGTHTIAVSVIGYSAQSQSITVAAGETATVNFELSVSPLLMDQLVVTATGDRRRAEVANVVGTVDVDALVNTVPITNMSQLLTARSPSVQVLSVSGVVGGQSRIRIRGQSSMSLSNDPIVYLDGIRVASGFGGAMETASRLDDLNPAEIESIDILKGPAAVALYGTDAANGVIVMTTKRGSVGAPRWNVFVESGIAERPTGFPTAYYAAGRRTDTDAPTQCLLTAMAAGICVQDELRTLNILEDPRSTPFRNGRINQTGVQLSGGSEDVRYFVSADFSDEVGTLRMPPDEEERLLEERGVRPNRAQRNPNSLRAINFRTNVSAAVASTAEVDVSVGYVDRTHQLTSTGGSFIFGVMRNALEGRGYRDELNGWWTYPVGDIFGVEELHEVGRFIGSVGTHWRPFPWLDTRARVGLDRVNQENSVLQRRDEGLRFSNFREGRKTETRIDQSNYTAEMGATATFRVSPVLELRSSAGGQYFRSITRNVSAGGTILSPGSENVGGTAIRSAGESNSGSANVGFYLEQVGAINERLFLTGSIRTDQNSAFGRDFDAVIYPRASVSWVVSQEPFFPEVGALSTLRMRLAYGTSGVSPGTLHALRYFTSTQTFEDGAARPGLQFHAIGNVDLEPERTTEVEGGFDMELFEGRAMIELTHYRKTSRDALVNRPLAPSLGLNSPNRFENLGSVRNTGWEGALHLQLVERPSLEWGLSLSGSLNDNELVKLGEGVSPVITFGGHTRAIEGYRLWGRWARPILGWEDTNGNGIIEPHEVQVGEEEVYMGPSTPTREAGIATNLTVLNGLVRIGALLDHRGGHLAHNRTAVERCIGATNCQAVNDPTAPLWEQARAVAASSAELGRTHAGYFENGAYTTLRELSLVLQVPDHLGRLIGASRASVSLAGRNLHTWTGYTGLNPQASWVDNQGIDFHIVPMSRYWTIRINATY